MAKPTLSWDDLRIFLAVQRRSSHGGAARLLGVDPSTVGRRIAVLEAALGARVFDRTPTGVALTAEGGALLSRATRMEAEALALERELAGADARVTGTARLTASDGLVHYLLLPALDELRRTHPGLTLDLRPEARSLDLARREADIAIRLVRPRSSSLVARRCGRLRQGLYASQSYLARRGTPRSPADLEHHDFVGFDASLDDLPQAKWLGRMVREPRWTLRASTTTPQVLACVQGAGLAVLSTFIAAREPRLVPVLASLHPPDREVWLVVHQDLRKTARIAAVLEWLRGTLQQLEG